MILGVQVIERDWNRDDAGVTVEEDPKVVLGPCLSQSGAIHRNEPVFWVGASFSCERHFPWLVTTVAVALK